MIPTSSYEVLKHQAQSDAVRWDGQMCNGVGATSGEPLSFLSATPEELLFCGNLGSFRLPRTAIRKVGRGGFYPWLFRAVRIHHELRTYPDELQFKPVGARVADVLTRLKTMGYPVG